MSLVACGKAHHFVHIGQRFLSVKLRHEACSTKGRHSLLPQPAIHARALRIDSSRDFLLNAGLKVCIGSIIAYTGYDGYDNADQSGK